MDVFDTANEPAFDAVTSVIARSLRAPIAQVSLVGNVRQSALSQFGAGPRESSREESFCADVVDRGDFVELPDAREHPRFAISPWSRLDPPMLHYAGAPLMTREGAIGSVCIYGPECRRLSSEARTMLTEFADVVMHMLDQRRRQQEQRRQYRFHLDVFDASPSGLLLMDQHGTIRLTNTALDRVFGYQPGELIGQTLESLVPDSLRTRHVFHRAQFLIAPETRRMGVGRDLMGRRKDGSPVPIEVGLNPISMPEGPHVVASVVDISDRVAVAEAERQSQLALQRYTMQLQAKNLELDQFAYLASHDLQAPLRTISNASRMLLDDCATELGEEAVQALKLQNTAAERMGNLITHLFEHSRLGRDPERTPVDVGTLVQSVLADLTAAIDASGAKIEVAVMPKVAARSAELRMVFQNLIDNAIKFRRADVPPVIHVAAEAEPGDKNRWRFAVTDNGIGVPSEHADRIFQLFGRLHAKEDFDGFGVGLAHCKKIVTAHNGRIWVESTPGEGSTFYFTIGEQSS